MKYQVQFKQIRNGSDPKTAPWIDTADVVSSRDMALAYAELTAQKCGTPAKVITVAEQDESAADRRIGKVIAYYGPEEHSVAIDWIEFEFQGERFRVDVANDTAYVLRPSGKWARASALDFRSESEQQSFWKARSKAIYG